MTQPTQPKLWDRPKRAFKPRGPSKLELARADPNAEWCFRCGAQVMPDTGAIDADNPDAGPQHMTCLLKAIVIAVGPECWFDEPGDFVQQLDSENHETPTIADRRGV